MKYNKIITTKYKPKKEKKSNKITAIPHPPIRINVKSDMKKWLLTDMGDDMILLDFLLITFEKIKHQLKNRTYKTNEKVFFTFFINWVYKYTICD
jgi:hypothetical protein